MNTRSRNKYLTFAVFLFFAAMFSVLYGPRLFSRFFGNMGALGLNHSLAIHTSINNDADNTPYASNAIRVLELATQLDTQNNSAWRVLGRFWLALEEEEKALAAWQHTPEMSHEMSEWAKRATERGNLDTALTWHRRYAAFLPKFGDSFYYEGLILAQQQKWPEAISVFEEASRKDTFQTPLLSDTYFQLGSIFQRVTDYRDLDKAQAMYDRALELDVFSDEAIKAETYYKRGEIHEWLGNNQDAAGEFQKTLEILPSHTWARLRHGYTRYWADRKLAPAEQEIRDVIATWDESNSTNLKWAYRYLGDIYEDAGMIDAAIDVYKEAAQLDPANTFLHEKLAVLELEK